MAVFNAFANTQKITSFSLATQPVHICAASQLLDITFGLDDLLFLNYYFAPALLFQMLLFLGIPHICYQKMIESVKKWLMHTYFLSFRYSGVIQ